MKVTVVLLVAVVLLLGNSNAFGEYEKTNWGMSIKKLQQLYPGGVLQSMKSGETHYRVLRPAFEIPSSLHTFAISASGKLVFAGIEFTAPKTTIDIKTGEYTRPLAKDAERIWKSLTKTLTAKYGKPRLQNGSASEGGITVWNDEHGDFVGLDFIPVDGGRVNILLRIGEASDKSRYGVDTENLAGAFSRTSEKSWKKEGVFDTRWGMGAKDIKDVYPYLRYFWSSPDEPIKTYSTDEYVEGNVAISFDSYKGRLYKVGITPFGDSTNLNTDAQRQEYWEECNAWRERILKILHKKYGEPISAPTSEEITAAEKEDGNRELLAWVWRQGTTGVLFNHRFLGVPLLIYADTDVYDSAVEASQRYKALKEDDRLNKF